VDYSVHVRRINVLPKKARNEFQKDGGHVPTNFWRRDHTIYIVPLVFVIKIQNFMATLLPGNN